MSIIKVKYKFYKKVFNANILALKKAIFYQICID